MRRSQVVIVLIGLITLSTVIWTQRVHTQASGRVTDGLIALYTFQEGSGTTVTDVSGVGTPANLAIQDLGATRWLPGGGLAVDSETLVEAPAAPTKLTTMAQATNELTIEAWIKPANLTQNGPARIVTYSKSTSARNFTLGQGLSGGQPTLYDVRLLTTQTDGQGEPSRSTPEQVVTTNLQHVVYTRDVSGTERIYVDGVVQAEGTKSGEFSGWFSGDDWRLVLGNERGGLRPWLGELHLVALFDRALTASEVSQNLAAGPGTAPQPAGITLDKEPASQSILSGTDVTFTLTVRNSGSANLTNVAVSDPDCDTLTLTDNHDGDTILLPGEVWRYSCVMTNVVNNVTNTASVQAEDPGGLQVSAQDTAEVTVVVGGTRVTAGQIVLYTFQEGSGTTVQDVSGVGTPLDLIIQDEPAVQWLPNGGLAVNSATLVESPVPATKVATAAQANNALTIEAWIKPANLTQDGPARIVTYSKSTSARNFTLGQGLSGGSPTLYDVRLTTTQTNAQGEPSLSTSEGVVTMDLTHVVYTRDAAGTERIYVNGMVEADGTKGGDFSNWFSSDSWRLVLANERGGLRPWLGELHLVALFDRALTHAEVLQNFATGPGTSPNTPPVANAGPDQTVPFNTTVQLDGSGSSDPDTDPLTFQWTLTTKPVGSTATLTNPTTVNPTFVADVIGDYTVELIVNDGTEDSPPDTVVITAVNVKPLANAGPDQTVSKGSTVQLDGSASSDANNDPITFQWSITQKPVDSTATLSNPTMANPTFVVDREGNYVLQLLVNDGSLDSEPDTVTITATNAAPVLAPVGNHTIPLGSTLSLTLTGSDANNDPLTFSATPLPLPANLTINGATGVVTFHPDATQVGQLAVTFVVSDGMLMDTETVTITVQGPLPGGVTSLTGRLLDTTDFVATGTETPVVGATVTILGSGVSTTSNAQGFFTLTGLPTAGTQVFDIDSGTANPAPDGSAYAGFREQLTLIANVTNTIDRPFFLPRIDPASVTPVDPNATTVVTNPNLGVSITIPPHAAKNPDGTDFTGSMSISEVPEGLAPAALPAELQPSLLITIQPVGVVFDPPVAITFPNTDNMASGNEVNIWSLEAGTGTFIPVARGQVTGAQITTIPGSGGVRAADWHFPLGFTPDGPGGPPPANNGKPCEEKGAGSDVTICNGELTEAHQLVSYRSLETDRAVKLVYKSRAADPQPVISTEATLPVVSAVPDRVSANISIGGVQQGAHVFTDTSGLSDTVAETIHQVVQVDGSALSTGHHVYRLTLTNHFGQSSIGQIRPGTVLIENQQASPFGAGWTMDGLGRLHLQANGTAVVTDGTGASAAFLRPAPGVFTGLTPFATDPFSFKRLLVDDFNGDTLPDLAVPVTGPFNAGIVRVHLGNGDGTFTGSLDSAMGVPIDALTQADLDQDGKLDMITASGFGFNNRVDVAWGTGTGVFGERITLGVPFPPGTSAADPVAVIAADFNGDGILNLATANGTGGDVVVWIGTGSRGPGAFGPAIPSVFLGNPGPGDLVAADFNRDGQTDVAVARNTQITVLYGDGTGQLLTTQSFVGLKFAGQLTVTDFNHDGLPDLAATGDNPFTPNNIVYVLQHNGANGFLPLQVLNLQANSLPQDVESGDLNADGHIDLITANVGGGGSSSIFFGNGTGGFEARVDVFTGLPELAVTLGDLDQTGTIDVVVRRQQSFNTFPVGFLFNADPNGGFLPPDSDFSTLTQNPDTTFTRRLKDGTNIHFDATGRQTSVVDRNGNTTTYTYDGTSDRVLTMTDPVGLVTTFTYGPDEKLETITDPANRVTTFEHDAEGNLIRITDPDSTTREFTYDARHRFTSQTSKRGFVTTYEYNFAGQMVQVTRPDASTNLFAPSKLIGLVDPASGAGTASNPAPVVRPEDVHATVTDANGNVTTYDLDPFGNDTLVVDPPGRTTATTRNADGQPTRIIGPNGAITDLAYDARGNVTSIKEGVGTALFRQLTLEYDPLFSQVTKVIDYAGGTTTLTLDAQGNLLTRTDALGQERHRTYNSQGLLLTDVDENGHQTTLTYDANGNLETITNAEGHVTQFTRDAAGNVLTITEGVGTPEARSRTLTYDPQNRVTAATDGTGATTHLRYDPAGNVVETELPTGQIIQQSYDPRNRVSLIVDPIRGTSQFSYDANGNLTESRNGANQATQYTYDAANQLVSTTDALNAVQAFTYDLQGNLLTMTDTRNQTTQFEYDLLNRATKRINPLNQETVFTYTPLNKVETIVDPKGQVTTRTYDALGRLVTVSLPADTIMRTYDAVGNLVHIEDSDSRVNFTYDQVNRLHTATTVDLGAQPAVTLTSTYNAVGDRVQLDDSAPGTTVYAYDLAGRLTSITPPAGPTQTMTLGYDPTGRLTQILYPNGIVGTFQYDAAGRLSTLAHTLPPNPGFMSLGYSYNSVGNILSIAEPTETRAFTYDALQQLTHGGTTSLPEAYSYDGAGNRLTSFLSTTHVHDSANRLLEDDHFTYSYDANGNLATKTDKATLAVTTYTYDALDHLIQITFPGGMTATYKYDALGRRIEKDINGMITRYVYDGQQFVLEYDGSNTFVARYTHGAQIDQPLMVQRAGLGFFSYHADHQGSIRHVTDSSGTVVNTYGYDAFGRRLTATEGVPNPFTFTGREFDPESGLYYYRARYYDPETGRFLSEDPIGFDGADANLYRYVLNNPTNLRDPSGEVPPAVALVLPFLTAGAGAGAGVTASGAAATLGVGLVGSFLLSELNEALNNPEGSENQKPGSTGEGGIVGRDPKTGEIYDPKNPPAEPQGKPGTLKDPDQPQKAPPKQPKSPGQFCSVVFAKCLQKCEKLCGVAKIACRIGCVGVFLGCKLASGF